MTLIAKFWERALNASKNSAPAVLLRDPYAKVERELAVSWLQAGVGVATIMAYLRKRGVKKGDRVAILGWNSCEWVLADLAVQSIGAVTLPIYPNSSPEQVNFLLKNAGATMTLSNETEQLKKVEVGAKVNFDQIVPELQPGLSMRPFLDWILPASPHAVSYVVKPATDIMKELKSQLGASDFAGVKESDLASLVYTSGSSGAPKGCMLTHGNIAAALTALASIELNLIPEDDRYLSFLPTAHVLDRVNGVLNCIWNGVPFASSSIEEMRKNVVFFKPRLLCAVPAVLEKIYAGVLNPSKPAKLLSKDGLPYALNKIWLWKPLLNLALSTNPESKLGKIFDERIFAAIRHKLGGHLRLLVSGGAPISPKVLKFFKRLGLEVLEGYGATETTSGITTNRPGWSTTAGPKNKVGSVGTILPGCEVRIVPVEGEEEEEGSGEIQLRGPQIFSGYWNLPEETAAAFTADGWFKTGDLGRLDADNFLYITGRLNGRYKTSGGKYVMREKLEAALKAYPIVQYSLPIAHGRKYPVVFIWVDAIQAANICGRSAPALSDATAYFAEQPEVKKAVAEAIAGANKTLEHHEQMQYHRIMTIAATLENGIITETLKIRSKVLLKRFEKEIDALYAAGENGGTTQESWISRLRSRLASLLKFGKN